MNAIEMAIKAAMDQAIKNLPPEVLDNIGQIGKTIASFNATLTRIERNQRLIMDALHISHEVEDGRTAEQQSDGQQSISVFQSADGER